MNCLSNRLLVEYQTAPHAGPFFHDAMRCENDLCQRPFKWNNIFTLHNSFLKNGVKSPIMMSIDMYNRVKTIDSFFDMLLMKKK